MESKLGDILIFSSAVALFIIGVHQLFMFSEARGLQDGIMASYWLFMVVAALIFWLKFRKGKEKNSFNTTSQQTTAKSKGKTKK
jgi:hypothetical protein